MTKSTVFLAAVTLVASLTGCAGVVDSADRTPSNSASQSQDPKLPELSIDSDGLECEQTDDIGYCTTTTFYETTGPDSNSVPYSTFQFNCPTDAAWATASISGGKDMMDVETFDFNWSAKLHPKVQISLDEGPKSSLKYVTQIGTSNFPTNILFLEKASSRLLKKLFGHKTMQIWATDVDGNSHQFDFDIDQIKKSVDALEGWGFDCGV